MKYAMRIYYRIISFFYPLNDCQSSSLWSSIRARPVHDSHDSWFFLKKFETYRLMLHDFSLRGKIAFLLLLLNQQETSIKQKPRTIFITCRFIALYSKEWRMFYLVVKLILDILRQFINSSFDCIWIVKFEKASLLYSFPSSNSAATSFLSFTRDPPDAMATLTLVISMEIS